MYDSATTINIVIHFSADNYKKAARALFGIENSNLMSPRQSSVSMSVTSEVFRTLLVQLDKKRLGK